MAESKATLKVGTKILFGKYPQTKVNNMDIITRLDQAITYYSEATVDNEKYLKVNNSWYKYEPLIWRVVKVTDKKALLITDKVIDCIKFYRDCFDRVDFNTIIHPNNWEYSDIRTWLNYEFFNKAFTESEKKKIVFTELDNGKTAYRYNDNYYAQCQRETTDMVFLLSYYDAYYVLNISDEATRKNILEKYPTELAINKGVYVYKQDGHSGWWLRSPNFERFNSATSITNKGEISNWGGVDLGDIGVVPAIIISL